MNPEQLKARTKAFSLRVIELSRSIHKDEVSKVLTNQLIRSATSVAANYRAACRAKSEKDFKYKINIVEEEADESMYWMEMLVESGCVEENIIKTLLQEGNELVAIFTSIGKSLKKKIE